MPSAGPAHSQSPRSRKYTECDQWRAEIIARLQTEHPKLIVLSMSRRYGASYHPEGFASYDPAWIDSLTRLVRQLRGTGAQVLVLGPIPDPQSVVPNCLSVHLDDATACSPLRSVAVNDPGIAAESAAVKAGGGQYADLTALFCTAERCPAIVGNTLVYLDQLPRDVSNTPGCWRRYSVRWPTAHSSLVDILRISGQHPVTEECTTAVPAISGRSDPYRAIHTFRHLTIAQSAGPPAAAGIGPRGLAKLDDPP